MISERKLAANRRNAKKSCGPRTADGKRKVSRNALRHGLAAVKHLDIRLPGDIDFVARALCGDDGDHLLFQQALLIAENQLLLQCIRVEKVGLIERLRARDAFALAHETFRRQKPRVAARRLRTYAAAAELERRQARFEKLTREEQDKLLDEYDQELEKLEPLPKPIAERDHAASIKEALPDLMRLARYERRAWSTYRRAVRDFVNIKFGEVGSAD